MNVGDLSGEKGRNNGILAVSDVIDHKLPITPQNYEIWLHYQHNWTPGLREDLDQELQAHGSIDERATESLYEKYFSHSRLNNEVVETGARLAEELAGALATLRAAGQKTELFSENLDDAAKALDTGRLDSGQLMSLITSLSSATKAMAQENEELSKRLETSSSEVEELRFHLQKVRTESLTDSLTNVANRKHFDDTLRFRVNEAEKLEYPLALAMCDIDFFKQFNDTWGHQTGDQVIRFVAGTLQKMCLKDHLVERYGGEEFAIIMPRVTAHQAVAMLERMRRAIEAKQLKRKSTDENLGSVTVSFGVADLQPGNSVSEFLRRADMMLYESKRAGRNCVTAAQAKTHIAA